jgi:hypothetical protein
VYSSVYGSYLRESDCVYSEEMDDYILEDETVYSDTQESWILESKSVVVYLDSERRTSDNIMKRSNLIAEDKTSGHYFLKELMVEDEDGNLDIER